MRHIGIFAKIEKAISIVVLVIMTVVLVSGALEVDWVVLNDLFEPPGFFLGVDGLLDIFGLFLGGVFGRGLWGRGGG